MAATTPDRDPYGEAELHLIAWGSVQRYHLSVQSLGFLGGPGHGLNGAVGLHQALADDLALFPGYRPPKVILAGFHDLDDTHKKFVTVVRRQRSHGLCASLGAPDSHLDIFDCAHRHGVKRLARERV